CHCGAYRPAAHRKTSLRKFNAFAIGQHSQATLDVELRHYSAESCLDLVRFEPAFIELLEFLQIRFLFSQKALRNDPTLVRRECFRAHQRDGAALVVFANAFACTCATDARTNDDIIAPNHIGNLTIISAMVRRQAKSLRGREMCCSGGLRPSSSPPIATTSALTERRYRKFITTGKAIPT